MKIRKAEKKDIPRILALLGQVLQTEGEGVTDTCREPAGDFYTEY